MEDGNQVSDKVLAVVGTHHQGLAWPPAALKIGQDMALPPDTPVDPLPADKVGVAGC